MRTAVTPSRQNRLAWSVVGLLFLGSVINYVDRAALSVVVPQVRKDLDLTNTEYGLVLQVFLVAYSLAYILGGRLADRLGYRLSFLLMIVFWSVASVLHAFAQGFRSLCLYRGMLGIGEGGYYPNAVRGAVEWLPRESRAKAVGLYLCSMSLGTVFAPPAIAWLALLYGWRLAFVVTGLLGLMLVPPWLWLHGQVRRAYGTPDPAPALVRTGEKQEGAAGGLSVKDVLKRGKYWLILSSRAVGDVAWYFYLFWISAYFQEARGFSLAAIGSLLWIPFLSSAAGSLAGAWASSALIPRVGLDRARKAVLVGSAALCMSGTLTCLVPSAGVALFLVSVTLFGHFSWSSNIHTVVTEISPPQHLALLYGITGAAGTLLGGISQPLIGGLIDAAGYPPVFLGTGVAYIIAAVLLLSSGKIEQIR